MTACDALPPRAELASAEPLAVELHVAGPPFVELLVVAELLSVELPAEGLLAAAGQPFFPHLFSLAPKIRCWWQSALVQQFAHKAQTESRPPADQP